MKGYLSKREKEAISQIIKMRREQVQKLSSYMLYAYSSNPSVLEDKTIEVGKFNSELESKILSCEKELQWL